MGLERQKRRDVRTEAKTPRDFSPAVFWLLLLAGMAVLGACMVVPAWMNTQALANQSIVLSERLAEYRARALADQEAIEAAQHSVAYNERLLIEELNYQRPGEQILLAHYQEDFAKPATTPQANPGPPWLQAFIQQDTRIALLVLSGALVLFAFIYYPANGRSARISKVPVHIRQTDFSAILRKATGKSQHVTHI